MALPTLYERKSPGDALLSGTIDWPRSWMRDEPDIKTGEALLEALRPFLRSLVSSGLAPSTLRRHFAYTFLLGGELIDRVNHEQRLRRLSAHDLLSEFLDEEGGPLCRHLPDEAEHRAYDSTCRQIHKFLARSGTPTPAGRKPAKPSHTAEPPAVLINRRAPVVGKRSAKKRGGA